jgi:glutaminase
MQTQHATTTPAVPLVDPSTTDPSTSEVKISPTGSPVDEFLNKLYRDCRQLKDGAVATYIPELAKANPEWFGICLVTCTGSVYEIGDSRQPFTIQSISKPFVYGMALEDEGRVKVLEKVGVEPTGDAFNSISLDPGTGRPRNPMINAGAIAAAGLIAGKSRGARRKRILETFSAYAGRELTLDSSVYNSESETGHRNRAIGYMLRNFGILTDDPTPTVELYFEQCSISVTCRDLGIMAATLANRGVNPLTGKQALRGEYVESVLSVMGSCGMYDYAGEWIYRIGMPAKSGVAGGVIAVLPGHLGIGVFSPQLDARGNSVRGIAVCNELSRHLDLHMFNRPSVGRSGLRLKTSAAELNSSRLRSEQEASVLREFGEAIQIYRLQGNLVFASAEHIVATAMRNIERLEFLLLDFKQVLTVNESACRLFCQLLLTLRGRGKEILFVRASRHPLVRRYVKAKLGPSFESAYRGFEDSDLALEWCEDRLLESRSAAVHSDWTVERHNYEAFRGFTPEELAQVVPLLEKRHFGQGEVLINIGDEASHLYLLGRGRVSALLNLENGDTRRLATMSAGMAFGELAVLDRAPRSAMVVADTEVACDVLGLDALAKLRVSHPAIVIKLLENLALALCSKLRKATRELAVLD